MIDAIGLFAILMILLAANGFPLNNRKLLATNIGLGGLLLLAIFFGSTLI